MSTYCMPNANLGFGNTSVSKTDKKAYSHGGYKSGDRQQIIWYVRRL